jgi:hypothetical protein
MLCTGRAFDSPGDNNEETRSRNVFVFLDGRIGFRQGQQVGRLDQ